MSNFARRRKDDNGSNKRGSIPSYLEEMPYEFAFRSPAIPAAEMWIFYDKRFHRLYTNMYTERVRHAPLLDWNRVTIYRFEKKSSFPLSFTLLRESGLPVQVDLNIRDLTIEDPLKVIESGMHKNNGMQKMEFALLAALQKPLEEQIMKDINLEVISTLFRNVFEQPVPAPRQVLSERDATHHVRTSPALSDYGLGVSEVHVSGVHMPPEYNAIMSKTFEIQAEMLNIQKDSLQIQKNLDLLQTELGFIKEKLPAISPIFEKLLQMLEKGVEGGINPVEIVRSIEPVIKPFIDQIRIPSLVTRSTPILGSTSITQTDTSSIPPSLLPSPSIDSIRAAHLRILYDMAGTHGWQLSPARDLVIIEVSENFTLSFQCMVRVFLTIPRNYPDEHIRVTKVERNNERLPARDLSKINTTICQRKARQQDDLYDVAKRLADTLCQHTLDGDGSI